MFRVIHDSHDIFYRKPFGAVACNTEVTLRLRIFPDDCQDFNCFVKFYRNQDSFEIKMDEENRDSDSITYICKYTAPERPGLIWYHFMIEYSDKTVYYGNNYEKYGGEGMIFDKDVLSYQITVYDPYRKVPEWFKKSIMYQIFPDRYFNSHGEQKVENAKPGSLIHGNWHDTPYYIKDHKGQVVRWDYFGGDLKGIEVKLPYLKELGVDVIYLNPVFEASSNHRYDTGDYMKIDPMLGTLEDFERLMAEGEKIGIRFILDGVFSHTGADSIYFNKDDKYPNLGAFQSKSSPYYNWFRFTNFPFEYESWWGIGTLPNVNEMELSYQDFIYRNEDAVVRYWIKKGAKGWRLDVADELPDEFIKGLKSAVVETDKSAILIGEVWEDASNKISYGSLRQYLWGDELDSVMNYPFRSALIDFAMGHADGEHTYKKFMSLYENYPKDIFYSSINLVSSHDTERISTILGGAQHADELTAEEREKYRLSDSERELAIKRLKLISLIQMTFPGVPCIYYGDEAGMEGYADPYNRGPYPWGREDKDLLDWFKKIIKLRKELDLFVQGDWEGFSCREDLFGFVRSRESEKAICIFNRSNEKEYEVPLKELINQQFSVSDLLCTKNIESEEQVCIKPLEGRIFLLNRK
ncbi:MAG: glycoside hydrolase family 13 protein [Clostridiales bacterium]|nr:glycoside hydrolase family 13 protein [Clostridiales bacterium]